MKNFFRVGIFAAILAVAMTGCKEKPPIVEEEEVVNGELVINNLPSRPGQAYDVEIYQSDVTIASISDWTTAKVNRLGAAKGGVSSENSSNVFSLSEWDGAVLHSQTKWEKTGSFPVVLGESGEGSFFIIKRAVVTFTNGSATIDFSQMENF